MGADTGPGPVLSGVKWGRPLLAVPSSEPTQQYAKVVQPTLALPNWAQNRWVGLLDIYPSKPSHLSLTVRCVQILNRSIASPQLP